MAGVTTEKEEIRLDKKVTVKSIATWATGAQRKTTIGDISIPPKGTVLLTREEIIAQAQNGNKLLTGLDGLGSHATWYIDDNYTRNELSFDQENSKQNVLTNEEIKRIFDIVTRAEMAFLMSEVKDMGINDYNKIAFCIEYTGIKP